MRIPSIPSYERIIQSIVSFFIYHLRLRKSVAYSNLVFTKNEVAIFLYNSKESKENNLVNTSLFLESLLFIKLLAFNRKKKILINNDSIKIPDKIIKPKSIYIST